MKNATLLVALCNTGILAGYFSLLFGSVIAFQISAVMGMVIMTSSFIDILACGWIMNYVLKQEKK